MEPLRGGHLCELSDSQHDLLQSLRPGVTPSEWAFRWVQGVPGVAVVLSGMSNAEQLRENIKTFAEEKPLNGEELAAINQIAHEMATAKGLPCTACRYCTSYCPVGLDIPYLIGLYNEHLLSLPTSASEWASTTRSAMGRRTETRTRSLGTSKTNAG